MKRRPFIPLTTFADFGPVRLRLVGTFAAKRHPVSGEVPVDSLRVDRWTPSADRDKDMVSSLKQVREGWMEAGGGIWFGFEQESAVYPEHVFDYYNLIVLRPSSVDKREAVRAVADRVFRR